MAADPTKTLDPRADLAPREPTLLLQPQVVLSQRYRITAFLARGGMGEVYSAHDTRLAEDVAIKVLQPDSFDLASLVGEARLARRITHPNVCRVFDLETDGRLTFLTMELVQGETLAALLAREGKLTLGRAMPILVQVAVGLDAAHQAGVLHRDLKPSNVLLSGARAVITDFGIARLIAGRTTASGLKGTAAYLSPEQVEGRKLSPASDLYALGVMVFELLTGRAPFTGAEPMEVATARLRGRPPAARGLEPSIPAWVSGAIDRQLDRDPSARFETAAQFIEALSARPGLWRRLFG